MATSNRVWGEGYDSKSAAKRAERQILAGRDRNEVVSPDRETVAAFLDRWIETKKASGKLAPKTLQDYGDHVRTRWIPAIGHLRMSELYARPEYILEPQTEWRTNGVEVRNRGRQSRQIIPSDVTLHHYRATLNKAFADNRRLHNNQVPNPAEAAGDVPPLEPKETITLTREEARGLQAVAEGSDDIRSQLILFGLHMGMRPGELLGLRRRDIDWKNGFIQVRQTVAQLRKRGLVIQENRAKNRTSKAPVELTAGATQALVRAAAIQSEQIQAAGSAWEDHNLVFTNAIGRPINPQWLRAHFRPLLEEAGITRVTMHGLRHTHATLLLEDGAHPKFVQERLRHSRISVTMDTYSHVIPTMRAGTAARVDRLLGTRLNPPESEPGEEQPAQASVPGVANQRGRPKPN